MRTKCQNIICIKNYDVAKVVIRGKVLKLLVRKQNRKKKIFLRKQKLLKRNTKLLPKCLKEKRKSEKRNQGWLINIWHKWPGKKRMTRSEAEEETDPYILRFAITETCYEFDKYKNIEKTIHLLEVTTSWIKKKKNPACSKIIKGVLKAIIQIENKPMCYYAELLANMQQTGKCW